MLAGRSLRILHAIHDFLPRHRAGSEIYALELCRELDRRGHHVTVVAAEYDPARPHGHITWRVQDGLPVAEIVNNWVSRDFEDTYRSRVIGDRLARVFAAVQPDVVHVHNLLNLSFDLPRLAHARDIPVLATLHDYTLVCPSGGQRFHAAEEHVCDTIEPDRCARCFGESPFSAQMAAGSLLGASGRWPLARRAADMMRRRLPGLARGLVSAAHRRRPSPVEASDVVGRLRAAKETFREIDLVVAPSQSIADEFSRLGMEADDVRVLDYGFVPLGSHRSAGGAGPLHLGFVGTLVRHKGVHRLIDAVRALPPEGYELLIYGDPAVSPDYAAEVRRHAARLPVRFMGGFEPDAAAAVYSALDVLVVPSLWPENSPLVIREAFMAGVPVVAARVGGIADLVDDGRNGLLYDPGSSSGLTDALRSLVADRTRVAAFRRLIPPVKSMRVHATEVEALYAEVMRARQAVASNR